VKLKELPKKSGVSQGWINLNKHGYKAPTSYKETHLRVVMFFAGVEGNYLRNI
jgi:hypothetical protein